MNRCCENSSWQFVADAGHADGCEFTLGVCASCHAHLVNLFHTGAPGAPGVDIVVSRELVDEIRRLKGKELKEFMRAWYRSL